MRHRFHCRTFVLLVSVFLAMAWADAVTAHAQGGTDFPGTVLAADAAAGKLTVKKDDGGTRFTFVVNEKTQFAGDGPKSLAGVKKGDHVIVTYTVNGTQYVAQKVTSGSKP
jgi:hypothetical protein